MSLARRFLKSSAFRTLETIINIVVGLFMLPFLVSQLGEAIYGIWILVGSITAAFYILDLGFASAVTRFISNALAKNDRVLGKEVVSTAWLVYLALALIICLLTGLATLLVPVMAQPDSPHGLIQLLLIITGLNLAIQFPVKAFAGIAAYHMRYDLLSISKILFKLLGTAIAVVAVLKGYGVIAVALAALFGETCANLAFRLIARHLEPTLTVSPKAATRTQAKELINFSGWTLVIDASRMLQERADIWVIGALLSAQLLTLYYVGLRLAAYTFELIVKAVSMNMPLFVRDFANGDIEGMRQKLFLFTRLNFVLAALAISGFAVTGMDVITLWMGPDFAVREAYEVGLVLLMGKMILFVSMPINAVFVASYKPRIMSWLGIAETVVMGSLLLLLVGFVETGIIGAALAVLISYALFRPTLLPILVARELDFKALRYFTALLPLAILSIVVGTITHFVSVTFDERFGLAGQLGIKIATFSVLTFILVPFLLKPEEKNGIQEALGRFSILLTWPDKLSARS
jgi:O-antigen/teichoic acid export membrane protein